MVGFARFLGRKPVVPNGTAFGAAVEQESHGDHAKQQSDLAKHLEKYSPHPAIIGPQACYFQACSGLVSRFWQALGLALHIKMRHQHGFSKCTLSFFETMQEDPNAPGAIRDGT
jgi:hypothetical protein